ncbi:uncharacterized protein LOC128673019 [Plodia interpunctella]|uniref:uncharacterized protein LOC128673019 n=1 Tax=Plodia interpunctella TaxID=58824 RepID=UPI0023682871|nr:uncharacterized protein LOC128673019 [Plodia interpunctella]XP_053606576.1 uncharacterized protein LOC128673019 [Plodia interpunctella]
MEASAPAPAAAVGGRREPSTDPVKAQGILTSLTRKERTAARLWHQKWGFYTRLREIQEEEALKLGMTLGEYRAAVKSVNCQPEPKTYPVVVDPSPKPLPPTSAAIVGRRALCPLERYGRLVKTERDYPTRPPLPPGQIYDSYKQTFVFLGSVSGDPISYKLPLARCEERDDAWARALQLRVMPLSLELLDTL